MTKKHRYLVCAAILAACVCIALGVLALPPQPGVTKANFERIKEGMSLREVKGILGESFIDASPWRIHGNIALSWSHTDGSLIIIHFNEERVFVREFYQSTETFPEKVRRWLNLPS
jgi:hypothetical protein